MSEREPGLALLPTAGQSLKTQYIVPRGGWPGRDRKRGDASRYPSPSAHATRTFAHRTSRARSPPRTLYSPVMIPTVPVELEMKRAGNA
jgi:hypothetical protein